MWMIVIASLGFCFDQACLAEEVTQTRVSELSPPEVINWSTYLNRSEEFAILNTDGLKQELKNLHVYVATKAPDGGDFKLPEKRGDKWFASAEAGALADVIISYQSPSGGWSKHTGYSKGQRKVGMQYSSQYEPGKKPHYLATFDNRSTTEQIIFLSEVWQATKREDCKQAVIKGVKFILAAQYPNGGWPQVYPLEGSYHDNITLNDDAMVHILEVLKMIQEGEPSFELLEQVDRQSAKHAFERGIDCVIKMQYKQQGRLTAWCAQHDPVTLLPVRARDFEPASLSGAESASMLKFLMTIKKPAPEIISCIEAGLTWLEKSKVIGLSKSQINNKTVFISKPDSAEIYWARFYDLASNKPIFPGRDNIIYDNFNAMAAKNKVGYDYYSTSPGSVLSNYQKKWRVLLEKN
jgi:PelA/Pel-15E family pectate lyase